MASSESVKDLFKYQTLKDPKLLQLDKVLYKWFTAICSEGKPKICPIIIENAKLFYDHMKIND
jgi:hypothetical protein